MNVGAAPPSKCQLHFETLRFLGWWKGKQRSDPSSSSSDWETSALMILSFSLWTAEQNKDFSF